MASIKTDAELMTNFVAAKSVPTGSHFTTALDEHARPIVVSLSDDKVPKLQIIRLDPDGRQTLCNLGACFNLPQGAIIQTFDLIQDASQKIFLAFAYAKDEKSSTVVLAKPFSPTDIREGAKLPTVPGDATVGSVKRIFMSRMPSPSQSSAQYPLVFLAHANLDQSTSWGDDITQVLTLDLTTGWRITKSLSTPVNVAGIVDVAPAINYHGQGLFVLFKTTQGDSRMYGEFVKPDDQSPDPAAILQFATEVPCPKGTTSIETFKDSKQGSALLIGSPEGIYFLASDEAVVKTSTPKLISKDDRVHGCKHLRVAQGGENLGIWFTSNKDELGYIRTQVPQVTGSELPRPVPLLAEGEATSFAPVITSTPDNSDTPIWQMIVANDSFGNLTLLEQAVDQGLWRQRPFYCNDDASLYHVQSYSMTIKAFDSNGSPVKDGSIQLSSASAITGLVNGRAVTLTSAGDWHQTDNQGILNFIVPTETIASQALIISGLKDSKGDPLHIDNIVFDPANKPLSKLGSKLDSLRSGSDLKNEKTESGESLFDSKDMPSDQDLSHGLECLKTLHTAYKELPSDGSVVRQSYGPEGSGALATGIGDWASEAWNWVKRKFKQAKDWFVEQTGKIWKFVCNIAGQVYEFVLDCVEKVGEALSWVWSKLKVAWDKLVEYLGFIFSWVDILKTKDQVSALISAGFDLAGNKIGVAVTAVDQFFNGLLTKVDALEVKKDVEVSPKSGAGHKEHSTIEGVQHSTAFNWTAERMKNGGMQSSQAAKAENEPKEDAQKTWDDIFTPAINSVKDAFAKVGDDIKALWLKRDSISGSDFLKLIKDVLKAGIIAVQKVVVVVLQSLQKVLQLVVEYGNKSISIPIFSALYKWIAQHDLTAFDAISLIIAIPATIFTKLITGSRPPQIDNLDADLLEALVFGEKGGPKKVTPQMQLDFNTLTTSLTVSGTMVSTIVNLIKFFIALEKDGTGGVLKTITKGRFVEYLSIIIDMISALTSLPSDHSLPGLEERQWTSYLALIRGGTHILASFVPTKKGEEAKQKALLVLDLAITLVNFGLYQAIAAAEIEASKTWPDYDEAATAVGIEGSILNAMSGVGYFAAFMFEKDVEISGVGLAILEGATVGLAMVEGINWKIQYDKKKKCLLTPLNV